MAAPRKYPDELRERATRLAIEARKDPAGRAGAIKRIADQLDVHPEALRGWVKRAETDEGIVPGTTSTDAARIAELEREVKELRRRGVGGRSMYSRRDRTTGEGIFSRRSSSSWTVMSTPRSPAPPIRLGRRNPSRAKRTVHACSKPVGLIDESCFILTHLRIKVDEAIET